MSTCLSAHKEATVGIFSIQESPASCGPVYYLNDELKRYPDIKKDQEYATGKVVRKFLSGQMKVDKDTREAIQKTVDNVTKVNILASAEEIKDFDYFKDRIW